MRWLRWFPVGFFLSGILLAFSWSLLQPGMFQIHDYTQVGRLVELRRTWEAGQFPAVWSQNFGFGYGMPLFLFYGPLPYYLGTIATWIGWSDLGAIKLLFILSNILGVAGMLVWLRPRGWSAALVGSAIFLAMPYRALDIFVRGALNEVIAISLLPWVLVGARLITRRPRHGVALSAVVTAALLLTHNITTLLGLPILGALAVFWIFLTQEKKITPLVQFVASQVLGLAIAAFFVIPSVLENKLTAIDSILSGYFDFRVHFLSHKQLLIEHWGFGGSQLGLDDGISFHLGTPALLAVALSGVWLVVTLTQLRQKQNKNWLKHLPTQWWWIGSLLLASALSVFMTIGRSQPLWEVLPFISLAQFPWRFLAVASVTLALLSGEVVAAQKIWWKRWSLALLLLVLACYQVRFHRPKEFLRHPERLYSSDEAFIRSDLSKTLPDFLPTNFDQELPVVDPDHRVILNDQRLSPVLNTPLKLVFNGEDQVGTITWNIADFPGWSYEVNGQEVNPELLSDGRRQLTTDYAVQTVGAKFGVTPLRMWAQLISLAGVVAITILFVPWNRIMRESEKHHVSRH